MRKIYQLFIFVLLSNVSVHCQSVVCPPNIDFENGNYGYWKFTRGPIQFNPIYNPSPTPTISGQSDTNHILTNGSGIDPIGGFPIVAPGGGNYSLKLGNTFVRAQTETASYSTSSTICKQFEFNLPFCCSIRRSRTYSR